MKLPENVEFILNKLDQEGYEGYIVGGCVRDYIMGVKPHDYDITTSALPEDVKRIFRHTVDTGIQHGTVTVVIKKECYELTTYRIDGEYKDNRHPEEVLFTNKLSGDLSRRDFTVNAIAYNPQKGFVDLFGGRQDIENKIIRGVGIAAKRFQEDALRMMRAVRFSAQLDFSIEDETLNALNENAHLIKNISVERIRDELFKIFMSNHNEKLPLLLNSGMTEHFMPELLTAEIDYSTLNNMSKNIIIRLSYILRALDYEHVKNVLKKLKCDNKTITTVSLIVKHINYNITDEYSMRKLINNTGEYTTSLLEVMGAVKNDSMKNEITLYNSVKNDCCNLKDLNLKGNDLIMAGIKGKAVGEYLNKALDYVMQNPTANERDILLKYLEV